MATKAFAYCRVSGKAQVEGDGFPRQRAAIAAYAQAHDIEIMEYFEERGLSGHTEWEYREAWVEMIGKLNGVKTIIVENLTRLARELMVQELILKDLVKRDIKLLSAAGEDTDEGDPTRVLIRQILGAFSQFEATMISAKLRAARNRMKEKNGRCEGQKPFGFYPTEASVLVEMIELRDAGYNASQIARELNRKEIPSRRGGKWHPFSVGRILEAQESNERANRLKTEKPK
jgi:DNA invertase Pin-like site-specific DNA recombinase